MYVYEPSVARCLWGSEKVAKVPVTKPSPLQEQQVLVTTEPSLHLSHFYSEIGTHSIAWAVLKLVVLLPQPPQVVGITGACSHTWHVYLNVFPHLPIPTQRGKKMFSELHIHKCVLSRQTQYKGRREAKSGM